MIKHLTIAFFTLLFISCGSNNESNKISAISEQSNQPYFSKEMIQLLQFQDERLGDSIIPFFKSSNILIREKAALAFASILDTTYTTSLFRFLKTEESLLVKKACIYAIGQRRDSNNVISLLKLFSQSKEVLHFSYLDAMGKSGGKKHLGIFQNLLFTKESNDTAISNGVLRYAYATRTYLPFKIDALKMCKSIHVLTRRNAAILLQRIANTPNGITASDSITLLGLITQEKNKEILSMFQNILKFSKNERNVILFDEKLVNQILKEKDPYKNAAILAQLKVKNYNGLNFLLKLALYSKHTALKTTAADALVRNLKDPSIRINKQPKSYFLSKLLNSGDMALESIATYGINSTLVISKEEAQIVYTKKLKELLPTYINPRQKETYLDVLKTLKYLDVSQEVSGKTKYNHPIDWDYVKTIPMDQKVKVTTNKGVILLQCKVQDAPGSVSNFLKQVDSGYYNGKYFHRVVPNFVIQTGCNRGDGWGAKDWTQRTEVSNYLSYSTGAVGLASAGNDTESIQWFVTHCPTPFLDGRYTIFAFVKEGQAIVNLIELGDKVIKVERI